MSNRKDGCASLAMQTQWNNKSPSLRALRPEHKGHSRAGFMTPCLCKYVAYRPCAVTHSTGSVFFLFVFFLADRIGCVCVCRWQYFIFARLEWLTWESSDRGQALFGSIITLLWGASGGARVCLRDDNETRTNQTEKRQRGTKGTLVFLWSDVAHFSKLIRHNEDK